MAKDLVIVESPTKAKTISRFLGDKYVVRASMGHVRDLPKSKMGVDIEHDFEPQYLIPPEKKKVIAELKSLMGKDSNVWIATDEDREGEAIGWHLLEALDVDPRKQQVRRIVFHEITEGAILNALKNPRQIDQHLVDAQQARRVLDRLVGYELSPLLWKKIRYGLSAGRVQSVAVRLIVDREREILAFRPVEYWSIIGDFLTLQKQRFSAALTKIHGSPARVSDKGEAMTIYNKVKDDQFHVASIDEKDVTRTPAAPFTTSTLQQEASRKLGFSVKKTMILAQQLYEGIDIGGEPTALITYMRTDSMNLSETALTQAKKVVADLYGQEFVLSEPRKFKSKKGAQEAHEAIRPIDLALEPFQVKSDLDKDQFRLYELIWKRTIACQMAEAILKQVGADIVPDHAPEYTFRATGQTVVFPGFMKVYMEGTDNEEDAEDAGQADGKDGEKLMPKLSVDEAVALEQLVPEQHFTKPPARYTEASLVKKLESEGIGRPSTYAPTISTIMAREYVEKEGKALKPTDLGMIVTDLLVEHFPGIVDYKFTAEMEEDLDRIADGEKEWVPVIRSFYTPFHSLIERKDTEISKDDVLKERVVGVDPVSGLDVVVLSGRFGPYVQLGHMEKRAEGADVVKAKKKKAPSLKGLSKEEKAKVKAKETARKLAEKAEAKKNKLRSASLPKSVSREEVTLDQALNLLSFPKELGEIAGEKVTLLLGRFGPYFKVGEKSVSLPAVYDPLSIDFDQAKTIIADVIAKKAAAMVSLRMLGVDPVSGGQIDVKNGRFGAYVTDGKTNASLGKKFDAETITFDEAVDVIAKKRARGPSRWKGRGKK